MHADPKSAKNTVKLSVFFVLLGSLHVKVVNKMFVKLITVAESCHFSHNIISKYWRCMTKHLRNADA